MVTWGANTTHTFGAPAPSTPAPAFGAPAPAGNLFGAPAPAATTGFGASSSPAPSGGLFGATPAPAATGLFGSAPSGGLFGSSTTSTSSFSSFGAPASSGGSLFGGAPSSAFGSAPPQQQQQQLPAQAALQAHMDASARQEAERVRQKLDALNFAYAGMPHGEDGSKFVAIVYSPLSKEERQLRWTQNMATGVIPMPPKPPSVSEKQWMKAVVENPDPENYVPQPLVGANDLQSRIGWQQTRAQDMAETVATLQESHKTLQERLRQATQYTQAKIQKHGEIRKRLLDVMRRVELTRCLHQVTQPDEVRIMERLSALRRDVDKVQHALLQLQDQCRSVGAIHNSNNNSLDVVVPEVAETFWPVLQSQRQNIAKLTTTVQKDRRDVELIGKRITVQ